VLNVCEVSFSTKKGIRMTAVYEGKKPFECIICTAKFSLNDSLKKHIASVHEGVKPYNCILCDAKFSEKLKRDQHILIVTESKKPQKCTVCVQRKV
jgi:uncharacterized Zn-finger protein